MVGARRLNRFFAVSGTAFYYKKCVQCISFVLKGLESRPTIQVSGLYFIMYIHIATRSTTSSAIAEVV